jgi:peptidoglycan-associated lipoprotein
MKSSIWLVPLLAVVGCAHSTPQVSRQSVTPAVPQREEQATRGPEVNSCSSDFDCGASEICIGGRCARITAGTPECSELSLYFPFDSSELINIDRNSLERGARCLKAEHSMHVRIEGNADERGTEEYNLALGDKRATAVEKYLEALGVSAQQLRTVSYGKERPLCSEHDEACWSKNRRAALNTSEAGKAKQR